ncbi:glutathionylspermidine synthase family protein [Metabacillus elymi]|uniref:Glutathionylspermidine synthase family protein n=1 Tax=Metabacillus elymi TaxID=2745198 RepID=A0ABX6SAN2_9BACI|nr:glutathionylspermidine synthase family protein [Metabacillus sp. KUDC1714]QNF28841.1 glutathionylspermidine synthase family protein [Metabacillus sp. KUDC1714]
MLHSFNLEYHRQKRNQAYSKMNSFWHNLYDSEYALYDIALMTKEEVNEVCNVTNRVGQIFFKLGNLLRNSSNETLLQLDIPRSMLPFIRHRSLPVETVIARVDLVQTTNGLKLLELNSDTPTFEKEVFYVNGAMCEEFNVENPNKGLVDILGKEIRKALAEVLHHSELTDEPHIVFTSHDEHEEDKLTTLFLMEAANVSAKYVPLHKLTIKEQVGLYDDEGKKIDLLYRQTYPLEHLIEDVEEETNEKIGLQLLELVASNKLQMINPISAFLLQSKAVQAVIWGMMECDHPFFSDEEKHWISTYFLPTYLEEDVFLTSGIKYVKKPSFGREGDTVSIFHGTKKILEDKNKSYEKSLPVYQKFIELPTKEIKTIDGLKKGKLLIGSFLINGKACGIGLRAGQQITDNNAYFLPVGVKR